MPPIIEIQNYSWRYLHTDQPALSEINLSIEEGSFVGIIGPNGSGKTTLAYSISGLIPGQYHGVKKGTVSVLKKEVEQYEMGILHQLVGVVFSDPESQFTAMTVEDELVFGLENLGLSIPEIRERLEWVCNLTDLTPLLNKPPYEISGGQKQRVALAAVLAMTPKVMILDEPTSMLDPISRKRVFDVLAQLKKEHRHTIIIIEHSLENLVPLADRMVLLHNSKLLLEEETEAFFRRMDLLMEKDVHPPGAMYFFHGLLDRGTYLGPLPLTVEEAAGRLKQVFTGAKGALAPHVQPVAPAASPIERATGGQPPFIRVSRLLYAYPDGTTAVDGIDLEISEGEFIALIGQNGSGKTTLSKCLNGLFKPTSGDVLVDGLDTRSTSIVQMVRRVGYVFQNPDHQLFNANCWDEIAYGPRNIQLPEQEVKERVEEAARVVGLDEGYFAEHPFFLTKGLRQRVAIASILALRPRVIIVDEPTTGQDAKQSLEIMDFLMDLNRELGHTVIIITHDMPIVARYARRVIAMGLGRILIDGPAAEVFSQPEILAKTFIEPPQITQLAQRVGELGFAPGTLTVEDMLDQCLKLLAVPESHQ